MQQTQELRQTPLESLTPMPSYAPRNSRRSIASTSSARNNRAATSRYAQETIVQQRVDMLKARLARNLTLARNVSSALPQDLNSNARTNTQPLHAYLPSPEAIDSSRRNVLHRISRRRRRWHTRNNELSDDAGIQRKRAFEEKLKNYLVLEFEMKESDLTCSICLETIGRNEKSKKISRCGHCFHSRCLDKWFEVSETCPNCRREPYMGMNL